MQTLRLLSGIVLAMLLATGPALADNHEGGDESTDESGDSGDSGEETPAPEPAPAPEPEPEPEPEPAPAPEPEPEPEAAPAEAAPAAPSVSFTVDLRERARFWIVPTAEGAWDIANLAHIGISAGMGPVFGRVEVRGTHTFATGPAFALQQAYAGFSLDNGLTLIAGHLETSWHNGRLVDDMDWAQEGNAFDGVTMVLSKEKVEAQVAYIKLDPSNDHHVIALRGGPRLGDPLMLDAVAIIVTDTAADFTLATVGAYAKGNMGIFGWEFDAYGQFSKAGDAEVGKEFTLGVRAGVSPEHAIKPYIGGGLDVVSAGFDQLLGNGHTFYGHLDVPGLTSPGLIDGFARIGLSPYSSLSMNIDLHAFISPWADDAFQGFEADIEATWMMFDKMALTAGAWIFVPGGEEPSPTVALLVQSDWQF